MGFCTELKLSCHLGPWICIPGCHLLIFSVQHVTEHRPLKHPTHHSQGTDNFPDQTQVMPEQHRRKVGLGRPAQYAQSLAISKND